ncbi:MAG: hypothetical protein LBR79_02845 [Oscillospiraceae bacterium]|nr:hypothetical protein [Oscillospiraceae bacterium]
MAYKNTSREILMQSHFLSDAFFDSLRSVKFTDRSNTTFLSGFCYKIQGRG